MSDSESPAPLSNNRIPRAIVWAFGLLFLAAMLALPFAVFKIMAATRNQTQGMTLADAAGLPLDSRTLRATLRENRDRGLFAGRFELNTLDAAKTAYALAPAEAPSPAILTGLEALAPRDTRWLPSPTSKGPWHEASGTKPNLGWRALFDEGAGVLWILGTAAPEGGVAK